MDHKPQRRSTPRCWKFKDKAEFAIHWYIMALVLAAGRVAVGSIFKILLAPHYKMKKLNTQYQEYLVKELVRCKNFHPSSVALYEALQAKPSLTWILAQLKTELASGSPVKRTRWSCFGVVWTSIRYLHLSRYIVYRTRRSLRNSGR